MNYTFEWLQAHSEANLAIILVTLGFIVFWFTGQSERLLNRFKAVYGEARGQAAHIFTKRIVGVVGFGIIPAVVLIGIEGFALSNYGVKWSVSTEAWLWTLGLSAVIIALLSRSTRKPHHLQQYPEIRSMTSSRTIVWSALSWMAYLLAYELMFRGFLLFACVRAFGVWPAIIINTSIYALVHVPKSAQEGIGAIPLGLLLCYITLRTESIFVAVVVHWVLSLANEWFSLKFGSNETVQR